MYICVYTEPICTYIYVCVCMYVCLDLFLYAHAYIINYAQHMYIYMCIIPGTVQKVLEYRPIECRSVKLQGPGLQIPNPLILKKLPIVSIVVPFFGFTKYINRTL